MISKSGAYPVQIRNLVKYDIYLFSFLSNKKHNVLSQVWRQRLYICQIQFNDDVVFYIDRRTDDIKRIFLQVHFCSLCVLHKVPNMEFNVT